MKSKTTTTNTESGVRILKSTNCSSLSGKTKLQYQIGHDERSGVMFRIVSNSNPGCFNSDWVPLNAIQTAFARNPRGDEITADTLMPLFRGKSLNTSFFICAALKNEGLIVNHPEKKRCYQAVDSKAFTAEMQALVDGKTPAKNKTAKRNASAAKKTTPRKKAKRSPA